jgi:hypothetical protein
MARYIDADKLCEALKSMASVQYPDKQNTILGVVSSIENFPTADVVPKSEVERWRRNLEAVLEEIPETKREVAREIFEDIKFALAQMGISFNDQPILCELEKKYTEDQE